MSEQDATDPDATYRPIAPRVPVLGLDELDDVQRRLVGAISDEFTTVPNLVLTLVRHPELYEAWLPMASKLLLDSAFDRRERELLPESLRPTFVRIVKRAFSQRRKMMVKLLKQDWAVEQLEAAISELQISPLIRAEAVTLEQFVRLTEMLAAP